MEGQGLLEHQGAATAPLTNIGVRAGRGLRWSLLGNLSTKMGSFAVGLVLARLLTPSDFGFYALALAATTFALHINDVGIIAATVQWRGRVEDMAPTAATMAIVFSSLVYGAFWVLAPAFAALAGSPAATPVVRLLTAVILVDGVTAVWSATLQRRFEQDKLLKANIAGYVVNASLSIALAANGAGPYSFAVGHVAGWVVTGVLVFTWARVPVRFGLDREIAAKLLRFGIPLAASLGVEALLINADYVIVGRELGASAVGLYMLAFNVSSWVPGVIGTAVRYVSVATFSRLAEHDHEALSLGVQRWVPLLLAVVLPSAVLMAALAHPLVGLYGQQWGQSAEVLRFLVVLMVGRMLTSLAFDILTSLGATRSSLLLNLAWAVVLIPVLVVGTRLDGIRGAAIGHALVALLVAVPLAIVAVRRAGVQLRPIVPALVRPCLGGAMAGAVVMLLAGVVDGGPGFELCVAGGAGMVTALLVNVRPRQVRQLRVKFAS